MKSTRLYTVLFLSALLLILPVHSQVQTQAVLKWESVSGAHGYHVEIRQVGATRSITVQSNQTSIRVPLTPGEYRVRISPVNKFGTPDTADNWQSLLVERLHRPDISSFSPTYFDIDSEAPAFTVSGNHFRRDTRFYLERNGQRITPQDVRLVDSTTVRLTFNGSDLPAGTYHIVVRDAAGQTVTHGFPVAIGIAALAQRNADHPGSEVTRAARSFFNAVAGNKTEDVRRMMNGGFDPNIVDVHGFYAAHYAAYMGHLSMLRLLREFGGRLDVQDKGGALPIHHAAYKGREDVVRYLAVFGHNDVNAHTNNRYAPLDRAAINGHTGIVRYLVSRGARINHSFINGETALHLSVYSGNSDTVGVLLENDGTQVNIQENRGFTPLHYAAYYGHTIIVSQLLGRGADPSRRSRAGERPVDLAQRSRRSSDEVIRLLSR
ncbi:MAG: ankyrin repeat domain-containing protein [Spirochaetota bacterium]